MAFPTDRSLLFILKNVLAEDNDIFDRAQRVLMHFTFLLSKARWTRQKFETETNLKNITQLSHQTTKMKLAKH